MIHFQANFCKNLQAPRYRVLPKNVILTIYQKLAISFPANPCISRILHVYLLGTA